MFHLTVPWWELVLRSVLVYASLLFLLRLFGKRQVGQLAPYDFVLLLVLSNAVQNSMNAGDNSLVGGLVSAVTLVTLNFGMALATLKSPRFERFIDGKPEILIMDGKRISKAMTDAQVTESELRGAVHQAGCEGVADVKVAWIEINGAISVIPFPERSV